MQPKILKSLTHQAITLFEQSEDKISAILSAASKKKVQVNFECVIDEGGTAPNVDVTIVYHETSTENGTKMKTTYRKSLNTEIEDDSQMTIEVVEEESSATARVESDESETAKPAKKSRKKK